EDEASEKLLARFAQLVARVRRPSPDRHGPRALPGAATFGAHLAPAPSMAIHAVARPRSSNLDMAPRTEMLRVSDLSFETDVVGDGEQLALFLHGFPESKGSWRKQAVHL